METFSSLNEQYRQAVAENDLDKAMRLHSKIKEIGNKTYVYSRTFRSKSGKVERHLEWLIVAELIVIVYLCLNLN